MTELLVRTFGGWRTLRPMGIGKLGPIQSIVVIAALLVPLALMTLVGFVPSLISAGPALLFVGVSFAKWDGDPLAIAVIQRLRPKLGRRKGYDQLDKPLISSEHAAAWTMPGPLAPTKLISVTVQGKKPWGVIWDQRSGLLTVPIRVAANSAYLADRSEVDRWVSNYGDWLAARGYDPLVAWLTVTVMTAPDSGSRLASMVAERLDPDAPEDCQTLMSELVDKSPRTAADVQTVIAVTFDPSRSVETLKTLDEQLAEVDTAMRTIEDGIAGCGVSLLGRATAKHITAWARVGFDPSSRDEVHRRLHDTSSDEDDPSMSWPEAGPISTTANRGTYEHDGAISVSWEMREPPRQHVLSGILSRLVSPTDWPRRVTMLYRIMPAARAADLLEREVNAATFRSALRRQKKRDPTARDIQDEESAKRAAFEEARGAGVVMLSMIVTITVTDESDLPRAISNTVTAAEHSKIRLRRLWNSQAVGFMTTLPFGLHPRHLSRRSLK